MCSASRPATPWAISAASRGAEPEVFFAVADPGPAIAICRTCPVSRPECKRNPKVVRVDAFLTIGLDVDERARHIAQVVRSRRVHGYLVLVDELHERIATQLRSQLKGLPRVEIVAWQRNTAPYSERLRKALEQLNALPPRSENDDAKVKRWIEDHRGGW